MERHFESMVSLYTSKKTKGITEEQESFDRVSLEMYQSFMQGYVRRINEATFKVDIGGVRIGLAKYSRLAQINLKSRVLTFSKYAIENVPERGRRYLVLHELAHVKESGHNKHFWDLVGRFEPDYRQVGRSLEIAFKNNVKKDDSGANTDNIIVPDGGSIDQFKLFLGALQGGSYKSAVGKRSEGQEPFELDDFAKADEGLIEWESLTCLDEDQAE